MEKLPVKQEIIAVCGALILCGCGRNFAQYIHGKVNELYKNFMVEDTLIKASWKKIGGKWRCPTCVNKQGLLSG